MASDDPSAPPEPWSYRRRVLIPTATALGLFLLVVFLWYASYVLLLVFASVLLAVLLRAAADLVNSATGLPDKWSVLVVLVLGVVVLGGVGWFAAPPIARQVDQLSQQIPRSVEVIRGRLEQYRWGQWLLRELPSVEDLQPAGPQILSRATGFVSRTTGALFSFFVVAFIGIYLALDPVLYTNGVLRLVPPRYRGRARDVLAALGYTLRWWLIGQLITMTVVGVLTTLGLWLLGVPLAPVLGLLAFVLDFVPNIGPVVAAVPAILLAFTDDPMKALYVMLLYIGVQQVEGLLIAPLIHQRTVHLPPVLTIVAQIFLGILVGPLGLLLATPLVACVLVLVKMLYVEQALGDHVDTPADHLKPQDKPPLPKRGK